MSLLQLPQKAPAPSDSADNAGTPTEEPTAGETVAPSDSAENVETPAETTAPTKGNPTPEFPESQQ